MALGDVRRVGGRPWRRSVAISRRRPVVPEPQRGAAAAGTVALSRCLFAVGFRLIAPVDAGQINVPAGVVEDGPCVELLASAPARHGRTDGPVVDVLL
jgi:hypothetical protein